MKIEYTGQSAGKLLQLIIEQSVKVLNKSVHNPDVFNSLVLAKKKRNHIGLIDEKYEDLLDDHDTVAKDISKCYTSVMYSPLEEWIRYDFNDKWEKYDGELKLGLYYVETNDTTLFRKTDVYSSAIINKAVQENIEFKIQAEHYSI